MSTQAKRRIGSVTGFSLLAVFSCVAPACSTEGSSTESNQGGSPSTGGSGGLTGASGQATTFAGGASSNGGSAVTSSGGALGTGGGSASSGGTPSAGGTTGAGGTTASSAGSAGSASSNTGGATPGGSGGTGGASTGGTTSGGTASGGRLSTGGASTGGASTGGALSSGGSTNSGGVTNTGGASTGGAGTGGAGTGATTIWIAGDSTVKTYAAGNTDGNNGVSIEGWGQEIGQFFNTKVTINNQAIGGRSVAFFMWAVKKDSSGAYLCVDTQGNPDYELDSSGNHVDTSQWAQIKNGIKAGDFLLIQFGTNDETHTCPRYVSLPDFETDLGIMADLARSKGATPIFVTPMGHRSFSGTTATNTLLPYANAMKDEATKKTVEVEDLNLRSVEYYTSVGNTYLATNIFDGGTTHFIKAGAVKMAELVAGEIRKNKGPLAAYLK
ncbi:MAG: hypothetical protein QM756_47235 [Polyangiaceae bacterium]